jgi:hypothetical protein
MIEATNCNNLHFFATKLLGERDTNPETSSYWVAGG